MPLGQIKQTRSIIAGVGALALIVATAGCTSSSGDGSSAAPSTGVTQSAGPSTGAGPSGSTAPSGTTPKPISYQHITHQQGAALNNKIGGLPGVTGTTYYPDSDVFEVYMSASASKLDRTVVRNLVKQELAKKPTK